MTDAALRKFFLSKLAPLQESVLTTLSISIDPNCESYFEDVFEPAAIVSQVDLSTSLVALWHRLGMEELVSLEPDFRKLARDLRAAESTDQKISDFIYMMY